MLKNIGYGDQQMRNVLQLNNGDELARLVNWQVSSHRLLSLLFADFDNDGFKDLLSLTDICRDLTR